VASADPGRCADPDDCSLREHADRVGVFVGAAAEPHTIADDPDFAPVLAREFNSLTPENRMKWPQVHPSEDVWNLGPADALVEFAEAHEMRVRGHTLVWPRHVAGYVKDAASAEQLRGYLRDHILTLVGHYAGRVAQWDVVNEPFQDLGSGFFESIFLDLLGPAYIAEAFELAHAADPDATLYLNEVFIEFPGAKFSAFLALVEQLLADGVPVHGVGIQHHVLPPAFPQTPENLEAAIRAFAELGLEVEITEMDVPIQFLGGDLDSRLEIQRQIYRDNVRACLRVGACRGVTFWGFTDKYSWIDAFFGPDDPLLFDEVYEPKPAYFGVREALASCAPPGRRVRAGAPFKRPSHRPGCAPEPRGR
jgi:endo-1,4-beta-xylanase